MKPSTPLEKIAWSIEHECFGAAHLLIARYVSQTLGRLGVTA